jgi:hypothetical protein
MQIIIREMHCEECGETAINFPLDPLSDEIVRCGGCGKHLGTVPQLIDRLRQGLQGEPVDQRDNK